MLSVYTIQGERIGTLLREVRESGEHQVIWEPRGLASGIYICRLESGGARGSASFSTSDEPGGGSPHRRVPGI